jgi:hypothetical protein
VTTPERKSVCFALTRHESERAVLFLAIGSE